MWLKLFQVERGKEEECKGEGGGGGGGGGDDGGGGGEGGIVAQRAGRTNVKFATKHVLTDLEQMSNLPF